MADAVHAALHREIVTGELAPGDRLVEEDLAGRFGVGRSAVRVALVRLEQDGLVEHERNRGAHVRRIGDEEAVEILEARAALESVGARLAAVRRTEEDVVALRGIVARMRELLDEGDLLAVSEHNACLHRRILEMSGHEVARRVCASLHSQMVRHQYRTILAPGRSARSYEEHSALVEAIAAGDGDAAETAMRSHLGHVAETLRTII